MKIVYLHQYFNTPAMPGGVRSYEMAKRLVALGHEVHMITSDRDSTSTSASWRQENIEGIKVYWYQVPYSNHFGFGKRILAFLNFALAARKKAATINADLVFATSTPLTIAIPGVYAARKLRVPFVFEVRDLWPELPIAIGALRNPILIWLARRLEHYAYQHAARIIALSPGMAEGISATGYPREHIAIVPNNCNVARFSPRLNHKGLLRARIPTLKSRKIVLYAGTFGRINGVSYLLEIAESVRQANQDLAFVLIGEGLEKQGFCDKARQLGLLETFVWVLDIVSKDEMPGYLVDADICISLFIDLPAMWSNSANKFFDSLAAGKPIAINYQGWQKDVLESSGAGILLPANDAAEAANRLVDFLDDADRLAVSGAAAEMLSETRFSTDLVFADFHAALAEAISEAP